MNIYALENHKVKCSTLNAGYKHHEDLARLYLIVGNEYTVLRTYVDSFHTDVVLKEFPDTKFNSVFFEDVVKQSKSENEKHPDYWYYH